MSTDYPDSPLLHSDKCSPSEGRNGSISDGSYAVQVAAFDKVLDAEEYAHSISDWGYSVEVRAKSVGRKRLTAVWIGRFGSKEDARNCAKKLKSRYNVEGLIVVR